MLVAALPPKMKDLNRRSFGSKLQLLASLWNVPLDDLPSKAISKAIAARNSIVHRGYYYEPDAGSVAQRDLWDHVLIMRGRRWARENADAIRVHNARIAERGVFGEDLRRW